jgi:hypothetical protein
MQTWDLGRALSDATLEGIMLGVVYSSTPVPAAAGKSEDARIRIRPRGEKSASSEQVAKKENLAAGPLNESQSEESKRWRGECIEGAVLEVKNRQQMEGVLDIAADEAGSGGGRVSFLVYRVD